MHVNIIISRSSNNETSLEASVLFVHNVHTTARSCLDECMSMVFCLNLTPLNDLLHGSSMD